MFGLTLFGDADAIELLKRDHDEVESLFDEYEAHRERGSSHEKGAIVANICTALSVHATIEEEIFYPRVRQASAELGDLLNEAAVEHQSLKDIISRLEVAPITDPLYDAGVRVLSEYVKHHVKEEETELFPKVRRSNLDLAALGQAMKSRKAELEGIAVDLPGTRQPRANTARQPEL